MITFSITDPMRVIGNERYLFEETVNNLFTVAPQKSLRDERNSVRRKEIHNSRPQPIFVSNFHFPPEIRLLSEWIFLARVPTVFFQSRPSSSILPPISFRQLTAALGASGRADISIPRRPNQNNGNQIRCEWTFINFVTCLPSAQHRTVLQAVTKQFSKFLLLYKVFTRQNCWNYSPVVKIQNTSPPGGTCEPISHMIC